MPPALQTTRFRGLAARTRLQSLDAIIEPLNEMARCSTSLIASGPGRFELAGQTIELPRYLFLGPRGGAAPLRIGVFAGIHGDEPAGPFALLRFVRLLECSPEIARGYCLFLYPVCNPTGFTDHTRQNRNGKDLDREFWRESIQPEIRLLQSELWSHAFHGLISLHADHGSDGLYGFARGPVLTQHLLRPALAAVSDLLPRSRRVCIDGFHARDGLIRDGHDGVLRAPPGVRPRPFEISFEVPHHLPQFLQEAALVVALRTILVEYRKFIAYALNV
jgi:hypothetical protein